MKNEIIGATHFWVDSQVMLEAKVCKMNNILEGTKVGARDLKITSQLHLTFRRINMMTVISYGTSVYQFHNFRVFIVHQLMSICFQIFQGMHALYTWRDKTYVCALILEFDFCFFICFHILLSSKLLSHYERAKIDLIWKKLIDIRVGYLKMIDPTMCTNNVIIDHLNGRTSSLQIKFGV
jgi:hypothetical protein